MAFWKISSLFSLLLVESALRTSAAPIGGSDRCDRDHELSLRYFEQDLERKVIFFDIITKSGTVLNTTFHRCRLVSAQNAKGETNAEAIGFELTVRMQRPLLKVSIDKKKRVVFSQNGDRARSVAILLCDGMEIKCIQFQVEGNEIGKHLEFSKGFVNRKLLSTTSRERNMADPFMTVSIVTAGVVLLVLVVGLCASCRGKDESLSPVNSDAQLVSVTPVKPTQPDMSEDPLEKRDSKNISAAIESGEKADTAKRDSLMRGTGTEAAAAVPKDSNIADVRLSADVSHQNRTVDDVFERGGQTGVKGQRSKGSKGSSSSTVSDRSSRGSTKIDEESRQEKVEASEHKDDKHHRDEKRHKSDKLHGLKKKLSIKAGRRASSKENVNENDETGREKEREGSKKDKRSLSEKGRNSKALTEEYSVDAGPRPKCPSPPHDRASRELPKLPYESDLSVFNPSTAARPLPERISPVAAAALESDNYESVDVRCRETRSESVGDTDLLYEIVETKSKGTKNLDPRPSSGVSQQYEAVDFAQLSRFAKENRAAQDSRGEKYTEVPDSVSSSGAKNADDISANSSTGSDLYAVVKDDVGGNVVPDLYAEVDKVEIGAQIESDPSVATDLYSEPDKPVRRVNASSSSEEQTSGQHVPAPPSVDILKSLSESGRLLSPTDSSLSSADGSLVTLSQDNSKTTHVFHRETDPVKLEQMYSKINLSTKKRLSGVETESSGSAVVEAVRGHQDESDNENGDDDDDATPPPIPSSLYAPLPTGGEGDGPSAGGMEVVISQDETDKRLSKTSLTYEEIGPTKKTEKQTEEKSVHVTDSVNPDSGLLTVSTALSVEKNRLSTNSEAYEEIGSLKRPGVEYKKEMPTNGFDAKPDQGPKVNSNSVGQEHDGVGSTTVQPDRRPSGNSFETNNSIKSPINKGNGEVIKTLGILPRNDEDNASGHYESLENIVAPPAVPDSGKDSSSTSSGLGSSVSNDPNSGVALYEEVEVRKEEKKTKHSRFSGKKLKTLGHI